MNTSPILLVEDDENDIFFMERTMKKVGMPNTLIIAREAREALDYLAGRGPFADRAVCPLPAMVLLDLHLPGKSGLEILRWIREQAGLASLLVIVLTSSSASDDIYDAYRFGANSYLVKPSSPEQLIDLVHAIKPLLDRSQSSSGPREEPP